MLFDKLCGLAEKGFLPESEAIQDTLRKARIFYFDMVAHEVLPKEITDGYNDNFFLPFPIICVEDKADMSILVDLEESPVGSEHQRHFINIVSTRADINHFGRNIHKPKYKALQEAEEMFSVSAGKIWDLKSIGTKNSRYEGEIELSWFAVCTKHKLVEMPMVKSEIVERLKRSIGINVVTALEEIAFMNSDNFFILESTNVKRRRPKKKHKKIIRTGERPIYTMLKPNEIRERMGLRKPMRDRNSPIPHDRRSHWRRLNWDNPEKRRKVKVKACWIGSDTSIVGNKRYKVLWEK